MLKQFTAEGRFECGLDKLVADKVWCFAPVHNADTSDHDGAEYGLGIAVANEPGYYPIPLRWCHSDNYNEMARHAEALNTAENVPLPIMYRIIATTMRKQEKLNANR